MNRDKATEVCAVALTTLGYDVTFKDPSTGVVKTAPKPWSVSAVSNGYTATATEDRLAWSIAVEDGKGVVVVLATPRGYRDGSEVHADNMWVTESIDAPFKDLWQEVDSMLAPKK